MGFSKHTDRVSWWCSQWGKAVGVRRLLPRFALTRSPTIVQYQRVMLLHAAR